MYDEKKKSNDYRFKAFGEPTFPVFTYQDILNNKNIAYSINPYELMDISVIEHINEEKKQRYRITEFLRENKYKLSNYNSEKILSGKDICDSPSLLEEISPLDVYKIAYHTGFIDGRRFSQKLALEVENNTESAEIVKLQLIQK